MARSPMFKIGVIAALLAVATIGVVVLSIVSSYKERCEVCIRFHGRTECREAFGRTRKQAIRTATDNACGMLAAGMTDSIACSNTRPLSATCEP